MNFRLLIVTFILPCTSLIVAAAPTAEDVLAAIERFDNNDLSGWTYIADRRRGDNVETLKYGPGKPSEREVTLVSVNGLEPDQEAIDALAEERERIKKASEEADNGLQLAEMIADGSLEYQRSDVDGEHFQFIPRFSIDGPPEPQESLQGTLVLDPDTGIIRSLQIVNVGLFKPRFGVKIENLNMSFRFQLLADGTPAPERVSAVIKGKAFLVASFDQEEETIFREFEQVGVGDET